MFKVGQFIELNQEIKKEQLMIHLYSLIGIFPFMKKSEKKRVLITGGTSGLGRSILKQLMYDGYKVATIGRQEPEFHEEIPFFSCDFTDLKDVLMVVDNLKKSGHSFDILINNAGILSPATYRETRDGFEMSYQINFLAHVLLTRKLIAEQILNPELLVNISSPIYKRGKIYPDHQSAKEDYGIFQAYSNTKLYMALFSRKLSKEGIESFSFNPGTFRSGIYRSQKRWFQSLYKIAAPFMASPENIAQSLCSIINNKNWNRGEMMNKHCKPNGLLLPDKENITAFWVDVEQQIRRFKSQ